MPQIAYHLRQLREEQKMSQSEFAAAMGVNRMTINNYETGKRIPDIDFAVRAAKFFDVTLEFICGQSEYRDREDIEISIKKAERLALAIGQMPQSEGQQLLLDLSRLLEGAHEEEVDRAILLGMIGTVNGFNSILSSYRSLRSTIVLSTQKLEQENVMSLDMLKAHQREKMKALSADILGAAGNLFNSMKQVNHLLERELQQTMEAVLQKEQ